MGFHSPIQALGFFRRQDEMDCHCLTTCSPNLARRRQPLGAGDGERGTSRPFPKTLRESIFAFSTTHDTSANGARAHASKCMTIRYSDTALKVSYVAEFTRSSKFIKACGYKNGRFELLREFASMEELPTVVRKGMRKALLHIRLTTLQRATID